MDAGLFQAFYRERHKMEVLADWEEKMKEVK